MTRMYSQDHIWVISSDDGKTIGVSDFLQETLGEVVFVRLPEVDDHVVRDEPYCFVESAKAVSDLFSPVTGRVAAVNTALQDMPGLLNSSPLHDGWICTVVPEETNTSLDTADDTVLLSEEEYNNFVSA